MQRQHFGCKNFPTRKKTKWLLLTGAWTPCMVILSCCYNHASIHAQNNIGINSQLQLNFTVINSLSVVSNCILSHALNAPHTLPPVSVEPVQPASHCFRQCCCSSAGQTWPLHEWGLHWKYFLVGAGGSSIDNKKVSNKERTKYSPREGKHQEDSEIRGSDVEGEESYAEWGIIVTVSGQQRMTAFPFQSNECVKDNRLSTCIHT